MEEVSEAAFALARPGCFEVAAVDDKHLVAARASTHKTKHVLCQRPNSNVLPAFRRSREIRTPFRTRHRTRVRSAVRTRCETQMAPRRAVVCQIRLISMSKGGPFVNDVTLVRD